MAAVVEVHGLVSVLERLFSLVGGVAGGMYGGHMGRNVGVRIQRLLDLILVHAKRWATKLCNIPALKTLQEFLGRGLLGKLAPAIANMVQNFISKLYQMIPVALEALGTAIGVMAGRYLGGNLGAKIGTAFLRGLRVTVRAVGRAVPYIGLAFLIWDLVELFDDDKGGRAKFVMGLAAALENAVAGQGLNVLVISTKSRRKNNLHNVLLHGTMQYKRWEYEYFIFESGSFEILGDAGHINWGMLGALHDHGKSVDFISRRNTHDIDALTAELHHVEEEWKAEDTEEERCRAVWQLLHAAVAVPIAEYKSGRYLKYLDGSVYDTEKKARICGRAAAELLKCLRTEGHVQKDGKKEHKGDDARVLRHHEHGRYAELSDGTFTDWNKPGVVLRGKDAHKLRLMLRH